MSAFKKNRRIVKKTAKRGDSKRHRGSGRPFSFQVLEDRRVLSITPPVFDSAQATLVIAGGDLDDTVVISESLADATIVVQQYELGERLTTTFLKSSIASLQFFGNGGNDRLTNQTDIAVYAEGGAGNDTLTGGSAADTLRGGAGEDRLEGRGGDDSLHGDDDADVLHGDSGSDLLVGGGGDDLLYGGDGDDRLHGVGGADYLDGSDGEDYLNGGADNDRLYGGNDDDFLNGHTGDDRLYGRSGDDTLLGGGGADVLRGDAGNDYLLGGADKDTMYGDDGNDRLYGEAGEDQLFGSNGEDYLNGGGDSDRLYGGNDADFLNGDRGDDRILGEGGDDVVLGGDGDDVVFGGPGADRLDGGNDDDTLYGEDGNDLLYGRSGVDRLEGGAGEDYLNGGEGNDLLLGGLESDYLTGELGDDRLEGSDGDDTLLGGSGSDVLHGNAGADRLDGGGGDDTIYGAEGNDEADGGSGNDLIEGGVGIDSLSGGTGADHLYGGEGNDDLRGGAGEDRLEGQGGDDNLSGGDDDDVLHGDADNDRLMGDGGNDTLYGSEGDDWLSGGSGDDLIVGAIGDDELHGGDGVDLLRGEAGNDLLSGDGGNDRLEGDAGADILLGGDGVDSLVGGVGRDLVIGGGGGDTVSGSEDEDILIGASTAYDADSAALRQALADWNSELGYEERVELLSGPEADVRLVPHETVFADLVADTLVGGGGRDWFVLSAINGVYNPLGMPHHHGMSHHQGLSGSHHQKAILLDDPPALEGFALIDSIDRLVSQAPNEAVHTSMAHAGDASKMGEHLQLFQLVRYAEATHTAVTSGAWADPSTWSDGQVPTAGARVLIPFGASVTLDSQSQADLFSIRVDGTLSFSAATDSGLRVDTLVVTETGTLQMGTAASPVQAGVTAKLVITDDGPIDRQADPFALGRGLITHGRVQMHGTEVTPFVAASGAIRAGDTTVQLASTTIGWSVGDKIAIAGTAIGGGQDETRVILAINGNELTIDPLDFDHLALEPGLEIHVTNLTRNVVIESAATVDSRRGHVMFMHNRDVHVNYAAFNGLGRTDKSVVLTDPKVDQDWNLVSDTGNNPRGRYSVHFHRNGLRADSLPSTVHGSVVDGGPGWGFVNHSSYVDFTGNVSYGIRGAAFVAEAGDEIGLFDSNLALNTTGSTADVDSRVGQQDFGFSGEGFWLQGAGVTVTNNVVAGSAGSAFMYYTRGLRVGGQEAKFLAENLDDPSIAEGSVEIPVISTPIKKFEGNIGYASQVGLTVRYNLRDADHSAQSVVSDSTFWNNETGVALPYAHNAVLRNLTVLVDPDSNALNGVDNNAQTSTITYDNLRVEGYQRALVAPLQGENVVIGGRFASKNANIVILPAHTRGLQIFVAGAPQFGSVEGYSAQDISMNYQTENAARNPNHVFYEIEVRLQYVAFPNHQLYFREQHADAIPFPEAVPGISQDYIGLTQVELLDQFGIAVGGEIAPGNAEVASGVYGLVVPL